MPFEITVISSFFLGGYLTKSAQGNSIQAQSIPSFAYFREWLFPIEYVQQRHRVTCSVDPHQRSDPGPALGALKVTFDLFRPNEEKTAVTGLSSVVDQLSIVVEIFLNSSPRLQCSDSSASNAPRRPNCISRRQRHASPYVAKGRIAVDCAARLQKYRPNTINIGPASALATVAELRRSATVSPEEPRVSRELRTDSWPVSCERPSFDLKKVGTTISGFCDERDPARVPKR
jgi:hypothetical protein